MTATVSQEFGPLLGPWSIESAALASVRTWLSFSYMQELERQNGMLPGTLPPPSQFVGGADLQGFAQETMPAVIVVCQEPEGEPEHYASAGYVQSYRLTAAVVIMNDDEDLARQQASLYATALMGGITQQFASDNPFVSNIRMTASPSVSLQDEDIRLIYTGQVLVRGLDRDRA